MIVEGKAKIITDNVFYNPRMKFCRDADMEVFRNIDCKEYIDALAATGVRGIRAAIEAGFTVEFNDISKKAVEVIKKNLMLNGIEAKIYNEDAAILLRRKRFDHVDIDPFGSPAEFIEPACFSVKRYLSVTATDTAALCGSATISGLRKYACYVEKTEYYHELGLRALIGRIVMSLTKYDKFAEVLISWAKEHYYRVHLRIGRSSKKAGEIYSKIGYVYHCDKCGYREVKSFFDESLSECDCGRKFKRLGPLWIGELHSRDFVKKLSKDNEVGKMFKKIEDEIDVPTYYDLHVTAKMLKTSPPPLCKVIEMLREKGFSASRTRFGGATFKTDAEIFEIKNLLQSLSM